MQKKKLIEQNMYLFERLQKSQREIAELKNQLEKSNEKISVLKAQLEKSKEEKVAEVVEPVVVVTEPLRRLEEKVIASAPLKSDVEYGAVVIGKIVVSAAEYSNKLTLGGDDSKKELINLILGKTEVAKAEILTVVESNESFDVKCAKIDQIATVAKEYFESVVAQIL